MHISWSIIDHYNLGPCISRVTWADDSVIRTNCWERRCSDYGDAIVMCIGTCRELPNKVSCVRHIPWSRQGQFLRWRVAVSRMFRSDPDELTFKFATRPRSVVQAEREPYEQDD